MFVTNRKVDQKLEVESLMEHNLGTRHTGIPAYENTFSLFYF